MKIKTEELNGLALDWALAVALGYAQINTHVSSKVFATMPDGGRKQVDHTDPATCMGLINEHISSMEIMGVIWRVFPHDGYSACGQNVAEAVARCVVAMRMGDEVDVPDELCNHDPVL